MDAASPLIYASVAEPPVAFITLVALPEAVVCWRLAYIAEEAHLQPACRIIVGHRRALIHRAMRCF